MLADSYIVPECLVRPGTFGGLISLYEANFIRLRHLIGDPDWSAQEWVSRTARDCDLHVRIEPGSRYTRLCRLTYLFEEPSGPVADPDLTVRIYLDARVVEVIDWAPFHRHPHLSGLRRRYVDELDRRWACNMVLAKWLEYLLDMGHNCR
jgi:uncharacterized protein YqiB (DUF1249 family)